MALAAALVVFCAATARLFVWPASGMPARVSAIVMLAGPGDRLQAALRLAREGRAPFLLVSTGNQGYGGPCPPPPPHVRLTTGVRSRWSPRPCRLHALVSG